MSISASILVLVVSITNFIVGKLIVGEGKKKISETDGKNIQMWGLIIISVIGLSSLFILDFLNPNVMKWFWLCFLIITVGFQTLLDWKFLKESKESKEYMVSLITLTIGLIYTLIFIF